MQATDWSMETDESAEARRLSGAIDGRFQVCHPFNGMIETADTLSEAMDLADRYETRKMPDGQLFCGTPFQVEIYDRMARNGGCRVWLRQPKTGTYCLEPGDRFTLDARYKCIERRGVRRTHTDLTRKLF